MKFKNIQVRIFKYIWVFTQAFMLTSYRSLYILTNSTRHNKTTQAADKWKKIAIYDYTSL